MKIKNIFMLLVISISFLASTNVVSAYDQITSFTPDDSLNIKITNVDATKLQAYFTYKSRTTMNPIASAIVDAGNTHNMNSVFLMALAAWEGAWGTSNYAATRHNWFGYGALFSNPDNAWEFGSDTEGVDVVARRIKADYLLNSGTYSVLIPTGTINNHPGYPYVVQSVNAGTYYNGATVRGWIVKWNINSQTEMNGIISIMNDFVSWHIRIYGNGLTTQDLINNPGFESGTASWLFYTSGTGTFTAKPPGFDGSSNAANLAFGSSGTNIQLYQTGITLEPNTRYRLSFAAYSSTGHDLTVRLFKHVSPYTNYMPDFTANLGTSWQTFTTEFTTTGIGTVNDGRFVFWLAGFAAAGDTYYIDDIRLEKASAPDLPRITTHPANQNVMAGQTATFSVVAVGSSMSYQWQKSNVNIPGATNAAYTTPLTALADNSAAFRVVVSNSAGSVTSNSAILTVTSSPVIPSISSQPSSQTVNVGQTATFSVVAGTAPLTYQWQKNGVNIAGALSTSYTIPSTALSDSGSTFRVNVVNSAGSVMSNDATLTVVQTDVSHSLTMPIKNMIMEYTGCNVYPYEFFKYSAVWTGDYGQGTCEGVGTHLGVDIPLPINTPIYAIADGSVFEIQRTGVQGTSDFGAHVVLKHDIPGIGIFYSVYGHFESGSIPSGIETTGVKKEDIIGYAGNTGKSSGRHLHFQIEKNIAGTHPYLSLPDIASIKEKTYNPIRFINENGAAQVPQITSISPTQIVGSTFDLTINGNNFDTGAIDQIYWKANGNLIGQGVIISRTSTQIVSRQSMTNIDPGLYSVKVKNSNGQLSNGVDLTITAPVQVPQIMNPGFESGTTSWLFYTSGTGSFTAVSPGYAGNNAAKLAFGSSGTNIQLYQTGVTLEQNTRYRLSFAAYSSTGHDMTVRLFKHVSPYTSYMPDFSANLGPSWQTFTTEFTTSGIGTVNDGRFVFWLAGFAAAGDTYYIDDIRLEKAGAALVPQITSISPTQIVGSTFDLTINGNNFDTGAIDQIYWKANGNLIGQGVIISRTSTQIVSRQSMTNIDPGLYSVKVKNSNGQLSNGVDLTITAPVSVQYQAQFAYTGWMTNWVQDGQTAGTPGGNQMEAIKIQTTSYGITYRAHVAYDGWLPWVSNGAIAGTVGQGKSLQAIEIKLQGAPSNLHVNYRVYVHGQGWQGWASDGATAGTIGLGLVVDAIEIKIQN